MNCRHCSYYFCWKCGLSIDSKFHRFNQSINPFINCHVFFNFSDFNKKELLKEFLKGIILIWIVLLFILIQKIWKYVFDKTEQFYKTMLDNVFNFIFFGLVAIPLFTCSIIFVLVGGVVSYIFLLLPTYFVHIKIYSNTLGFWKPDRLRAY